eukprot:IDg23761t1
MGDPQESAMARSISRPTTNFRCHAVSGTANLQFTSAEGQPSAQAIALSQDLQVLQSAGIQPSRAPLAPEVNLTAPVRRETIAPPDYWEVFLQSFKEELPVVQTTQSIVPPRRLKLEQAPMVLKTSQNSPDSDYDDSDLDTSLFYDHRTPIYDLMRISTKPANFSTARKGHSFRHVKSSPEYRSKFGKRLMGEARNFDGSYHADASSTMTDLSPISLSNIVRFITDVQTKFIPRRNEISRGPKNRVHYVRTKKVDPLFFSPLDTYRLEASLKFPAFAPFSPHYCKCRQRSCCVQENICVMAKTNYK